MVGKKKRETTEFIYVRKKITHLYKNTNYGDRVEVYYFNDLIEIDNFGNLFINGHVRKGEPTGNGYLKNGLMTSIGRKVNFRLHSIVGQVFLMENMGTDLIVNHKNLDKLDNKVENLEWITQKENRQHWKNAEEKKKHKENLTFNFPNFSMIKELSPVTNEMRL